MRGFLRIFFRVLLYSVLMLLVLLAVALVALLFFEQKLPDAFLSRALADLSNDTMLVTAESASFRFSRGVTLRNLRVFERKRHHTRPDEPVKPFLTAAAVELELDLRTLPWSRRSMLKGVTFVNLSYPRLPEGYYVPDSVEFPGTPDFRETNEPLKMDIPPMDAFKVVLVNPRILGVAPKYVELPSVAMSYGSLRVERIHLQWADTDALMVLDGGVELDLNSQIVRGEVHGQARQHNIRPMLVALDITNSLPFIDAFTKVEPPVDASCRFDVNLSNNDLHLFLDLHPIGGMYNGVPLSRADGTVDVRVFVRDTFQNARIEVGSGESPLKASLADGSAMVGTIVYENTNDVGSVLFDVRSHTSISNALAVADVLNDGSLDCIVAETVPDITLQGRLAVDPAHSELNDLRGTLAFERGAFFSVPLRDASAEFRLKGCDVTFTNVVAKSPHGGSLTGGGVLSIPGFKQDNAKFGLGLEFRDVPLLDFATAFGMDAGDRHGIVEGRVDLSGPLASNVVERLNGSGRISCSNGHLAQMKLFAGLTDYLAKHVPGISGLVNQSRGSLDFAITNGVFSSSDVRIEGEIFSIQARGKYDIVKDDLDFTARVTFTRNDSFLGKLATPITWPFANISKMLFDFRVRGKIDDPSWTYNKNLFDRFK